MNGAIVPVQEVSVVADLKRNDGVGEEIKQCVDLVLDASPSMQENGKDEQSRLACEKLLEMLAHPVNANGFEVSAISFNERAQILHDWILATQLAGQLKRLPFGNYTNITSGIEMAFDQLTPDKRDRSAGYLRPVVILFTDGRHNRGPSPIDAAKRLQAIADVVCAAFGEDADADLLAQIATSPEHVYKCATGEDLRRFMARAAATMSAGLARKQDSTKPLAQMK